MRMKKKIIIDVKGLSPNTVLIDIFGEIIYRKRLFYKFAGRT